MTPQEIPGLPQEVLYQLLEKDPFGWDAVTIQHPGGRMLLIYNPRKSAGRRVSDISHELAHVILGHNPSKMILSSDASFTLRTYDQKQEDEADWLGWTLLLPRQALVRSKRRGLSIEQIASNYKVTKDLVKFRMSITGVSSQSVRVQTIST
jgi:Zn-dependent peptidase ImmA (M78 family)